jgi:hypothetical protein
VVAIFLPRTGHPRETPDRQTRGMALETSKFIQGVYSFVGAGLTRTVPFSPAIKYAVPFDKRTQLIYLRAGNSTDRMIYLVLMRNEQPMRYFPIGANGAVHVPLAIVDDIEPESQLELLIGAPEGASGSVVVDVGLVEV